MVSRARAAIFGRLPLLSATAAVDVVVVVVAQIGITVFRESERADVQAAGFFVPLFWSFRADFAARFCAQMGGV